MRSETQKNRSHYTGGPVSRALFGSHAVDLSTDNSQTGSRPDTRSESHDDGNARWNLHGGADAHGKDHAERDAGTDVSPPPRLPLNFALGGFDTGAGLRGGYAARVYEESDDNADDEDTDEGGDDCERANDEEELGECSPAGNGAAAPGMFSQGACARHLDVEARKAAPTAGAQPVDRLGFHTAKRAEPNVPGQHSIGAAMYAAAMSSSATEAAPAAANTFRRATPVARAAYSVGYDHAVGESPANSLRASPLRNDGAAVSAAATKEAGVLERASPKLTTTDTLGIATRGGPGTTVASQSFGYSMGDAKPVPSPDVRYVPAVSVAHSAAGSRTAYNRNLGTYSAFISATQASEVSPVHGKTSSLKESMQGALAHGHSSTTSSPLSPQRPTVGATDDMHAHRCSDHASATGFDHTLMSPVLVLDEGANAQNSGDEPCLRDAERVGLPVPTEPTMAAIAVHAVPPATMGSALVIPGEPKPRLSSGRRRSAENSRANRRASASAADVAKPACEQEGHVRSPSNTAASTVRESLSPAVAPLPTRQHPLESVRIGETTEEAADAVNSSAASERVERHSTAAKSDAAPVRAPTMALSISVTNVFNYSEAERMWLSCDRPSTLPACSTPRSTLVNGRKVPPATAGASDKASLPPSASALKVSLYCRPLLVQLPSPSLHASLLCAAGDSALVRVTLAVLYYAPRVLVTSLLRALICSAVVFFVLTAGLVAMDAAWSQWPILSVYTAEVKGNAAMMILSTREWLASLGIASE
ncbi:hypothetical protein LMJF_31_1390 [Leishmania major strain Friedlin]|uniref:Uncharacterized protein n=1 Tax=Leishmania major TaxID=5664 RepID=Q4Q6C4_LEIMA|nr:hypothetical protein LMJF_31_1390 [Leishmania major strain Friedlin]CAG9579304.1 hypothetical_protein_-_conserved [Leishmania major strain Friedlin]CAJ08326.1 hypothetical protein LMJF_31_1390 [Leishmania major strain Friedlin]|eukprot:XP_001685124.1 hypothetical protein LMJF_31_1390 [Leishmania major strain Friedlin]